MQKPVVNVMVKAARAAGNVLLRGMHKLDAINVVEKDRMDFASEMDEEAEKAAIMIIGMAKPMAPFTKPANSVTAMASQKMHPIGAKTIVPRTCPIMQTT